MKDYMLSKIISWILGGSLFEQIKLIVEGLLNEDIPGSQKREEALKRLRSIGAKTATFILNLGIEAAVFMLKAKSGQVK